MSQNDFTIANQGFPAFRADLNSALQALASNSSGATAPSTTFANMWWYDSANNIMYIRNEDNDAWIKFAELDQTNDKFVLSGTLQLDDGTVSAPALTFNSDTNMGIYRGGTDILKFVTAGTDAITIDASQNVTLGGELTLTSHINMNDNDTIKLGASDDLQIYHSGTHSFISENGTGNLLIRGTDLRLQDSGGNDFIEMNDTGAGGTVNLKHQGVTKLNTTSTGIDVTGTVTADDITLSDADTPTLTLTDTTNTLTTFLQSGNSTAILGTSTAHDIRFQANSTDAIRIANNGDISFYEDTGTTPKLFWDASAESLGIGLSSNIDRKLHVEVDNTYAAKFGGTAGGDFAIEIGQTGTNQSAGFNSTNETMKFSTEGSEKMRLDSGNLLVGTTSESGGLQNKLTSHSVGKGQFSVIDTTAFSTANVGGALNLGGNYRSTGDAQAFCRIEAVKENTTNNNYSYALQFSTTKTGNANFSTVAMRIDSDGNLLVGTTNTDPTNSNVVGIAIKSNGQINHSSETDAIVANRKGSDGNIVLLRQDGTTEGTISVSGTTVSYNGGHLARWSRLLDNSKDTSIVKGTVMTNLDEMVEWDDEDNEQLNKMAVSTVEGDANVAGVFVNWDNDDDWNDMNIAMTGDMVIRIAQGTTVARGDLLMSAGDGTAKPQGDEIVRSKTIAKVTSTNVSHTYDDGTYLVPCVLMAC